MMRTDHKHNKGVALILALLFIALLTVLVIEFSYESQVEASFATNQGSDFEAYLAAKSAVAQGLGLLATDLADTQLNGEPEVDSVLDPVPWAQGLPFEPLNEATMRASISDEYGKINLNALLDSSEETPKERETLVNALVEFFRYRQLDNEESAEAIVDAILDWLDYNDDDDERQEGAENDYYNGLENPFPCKNGPMDSIEELLLIKHMTPKMYFGDPEKEQLPLSEYLTVHGDWNGQVNINTAREEVIAAVIAGAGGTFDIAQGQQIREQALNEPFMDASQFSQFGIPANTNTGRNTGMNTGTGNTNTNRTSPQNNRNNSFLQKSNEQKEGGGGGGGGGIPQTGAPFRVSSNVFRIYGDGMLEEIMVRIEAYVWRTPLTPPEEQAIMNPPVVEDPRAQDEIPMEATTMPSEAFRILDWRVIR